MTITVNRWTAVLLIAAAGVLAGLALGRITEASSAPVPASASYVAPFETSLKQIAHDVHSMKRAIGEPGISGDIRELLDKIKGNTYGTCQAAGGSPFCHSF